MIRREWKPMLPSLIWRVLGWLRPQAGRLACGLGLALLASLTGVGLLAVAGWFLAAMAVAGSGGQRLDYFTPAACIRALALTRIGSRYAERLLNHDLTLRSLHGLRDWLFQRLWRQSPVQTAWLGQDELFSRLRADVDRLEHMYLSVALPVVVAALSMAAALLVEACYLWPLAGSSLLLALLAGVGLPAWSLHRSRLPARQLVQGEARLRRLLGDAVRGAAELAVYGHQPRVLRQAAAASRAQAAARERLERIQATNAAAWPLVLALAVTLALGLAAHALAAGRLLPAEVAMLCLLQLSAFEALSQLAEVAGQLAASCVAAERVFALAELAPQPADPCSPVVAPADAAADFALAAVSLRYGRHRPWVCQELSLALPRGMRVAIGGPSGAGKSSLLALLLRFIDPERGEVHLDGRPLPVYAQAAVRAQIAVAEQKAHVFNASLRDNLLLARPQATTEELAQVLQVAQLSRWVQGLPAGLDTWLGEGGARVSGGEARRLAIARALLAARPVLALDEPTEGLDADTAQALLEALAGTCGDGSVWLITHRRSGLAGWIHAQFELLDGRLYPRGAGA